MTEALLIVIVLLGGGLIWAVAWFAHQVNNLRKEVTRFESRLLGIETTLAEQEKALAEIRTHQGSNPWRPLIESLSALVDIPRRGLWPVLARIGFGAVQSYRPNRRTQRALPKRNTDTESRK